MNRNFFCRKQLFLECATVLCLFGAAQFASAQVGPASRRAPDISIFATATDAKPNFRYLYDRAVYGFSLGGFWQTRHILGLEVRGSILKWGSDQHEESALAGPQDFVDAAFCAGASGYVNEGRLSTDISPAIREAMSGRTFISASLPTQRVDGV
jgi:hypothetical protein